MRLFGFEITRAKAYPAGVTPTYPGGGGGWWPVVREPFTGAWQRNLEIRRESVLTFGAVYSCVTLIASDIGKLRLKLVEQDSDGIWSEIEVPAFSPVIRKPNDYQHRIKFYEQWIVSKLLHGNTFVYKDRDARGVVVGLYVLDPTRTKPLVAPTGDVFYELSKDNLSGIEDDKVVVPASEIIHDVMVPLFHPLCGVSPLTACGLAASHGMTIQRRSSAFFENNSQPSGILTAPGKIDPANAERIKAVFTEMQTGSNFGRVAVMGDGLKYETMSMSALDSQLIEQLKMDQKDVCTAFHVPGYMVGVGEAPTYNNIEALNQQYYTQCLQSLIESIELSLDEGLGLVSGGKRYGTEFDLDDLLRMDTATRVKTYSDAIRGGLYKPNEGRKKFDLPPVEGGDEVYLQQQNFSLSALAKRDAKEDPFETASSASGPAAPQPDAAANDNATAEQAAEALVEIRKGLAA